MSDGSAPRSPLAEGMAEQRAEALEWLRSLVDDPRAYDFEAATAAVEAAAEQHAEAHPRAMLRDWVWVRAHAWGTCELLDAVRIPGPPGAPWLSLFGRPLRWRQVRLQEGSLPKPGALFGGGGAGRGPWLAEVVGPHPRFGLEREFVDAAGATAYGKVFWAKIGGLYEALDGGERVLFLLTATCRQPLTRAEAAEAVGTTA